MVMPRHVVGPSGRNRLIESSRERRPCSESMTIAAAVNCLPTDPDWYTVLSVAGT